MLIETLWHLDVHPGCQPPPSARVGTAKSVQRVNLPKDKHGGVDSTRWQRPGFMTNVARMAGVRVTLKVVLRSRNIGCDPGRLARGVIYR